MFNFPTKCKHVIRISYPIIPQLTPTSDTYALGENVYQYSMAVQQGEWTEG